MSLIYIQLEGSNNDRIDQEGDPINGHILLEAYDPIINSTAGEDSGSRFNIDQRTGFKVLPGELVREWSGALVRPESHEYRSLQDFVRVKAEKLEGPKRPEPPDVFITTDVDPDDY